MAYLLILFALLLLLHSALVSAHLGALNWSVLSFAKKDLVIWKRSLRILQLAILILFLCLMTKLGWIYRYWG